MTPAGCPFEADVLAAVQQARWPEAADAGLRAHAAECPACSEAAAIGGAMCRSRDELTACAAIPDSGRIWWLAQRRARVEAARVANRPMIAARVIALACALGVLAANFGRVSAWLQAARGWFESGLGGVDIAAWFARAGALLAGHGALALVMIAVLALVPAVYLALGRD
jgi:hypothetical protein